MASKSEGGKRGAGPAVVIVLALLAIPLLVFTPAVLSLVEHSLWGTNHVEDFFRSIGLHDELGAIYDQVGKVLRLLGLDL